MPKMKKIKKVCEQKQRELEKVVRDATYDKSGCKTFPKKQMEACIESNYTEPMHEIQRDLKNAGCPNLKKK